jgi:alkanesulfonate monooxygenase SsuD/methylene tetrahydromethanopterin reductase-like flavin-dependent oxidoreductase (luciferase family)
VNHDGRHYRVQDVTLPRPVQRPRVPVWIGGYWPHRPPMQRAAQWDGAVPLFLSAGHGHPPPVDEVRELVAYIRGHRDGDPGRPFEVVLGGTSPTKTAHARELLVPLIEAGATWRDERRPIDDEINRLEPVLRRVEERIEAWLDGVEPVEAVSFCRRRADDVTRPPRRSPAPFTQRSKS